MGYMGTLLWQKVFRNNESLLSMDATTSGNLSATHVDGCQNYGPFLGTLNIRCRTIIGTQKGHIILTTTHVLKTWLVI